jgi:hypothetical protein
MPAIDFEPVEVAEPSRQSGGIDFEPIEFTAGYAPLPETESVSPVGPDSRPWVKPPKRDLIAEEAWRYEQGIQKQKAAVPSPPLSFTQSIEIPRLTAEEVQSQLGESVPISVGSSIVNVPAGTVAGMFNLGSELAEFMTSPAGVATTVLTSGPAVLSKLVMAGFGVAALREVPELARETAEALESRDPQKITEAIGHDAIATGMLLGGAKALRGLTRLGMEKAIELHTKYKQRGLDHLAKVDEIARLGGGLSPGEVAAPAAPAVPEFITPREWVRGSRAVRLRTPARAPSPADTLIADASKLAPGLRASIAEAEKTPGAAEPKPVEPPKPEEPPPAEPPPEPAPEPKGPQPTPSAPPGNLYSSMFDRLEAGEYPDIYRGPTGDAVLAEHRRQPFTSPEDIQKWIGSGKRSTPKAPAATVPATPEKGPSDAIQKRGPEEVPLEVPPGTGQEVGARIPPAEETAAAPAPEAQTPVAAEVKPPELMTPEEHARFVVERDAAEGHREAIRVQKGEIPFKATPDGVPIYHRLAPMTRTARGTLNDAIEQRKPLSASLVDGVNAANPDHPLRMEGYVREGDRYVFKGESAEAKAPETAVPKPPRNLLPSEVPLWREHGMLTQDAIAQGWIIPQKRFTKAGTDEIVIGYSPASNSGFVYDTAIEAVTKEKALRSAAESAITPDEQAKAAVWQKMSDAERREVRRNPRAFEVPGGVNSWELLGPYAEKQGYVREGDRYVLKGESATPKPAAAPPEPPAEKAPAAAPVEPSPPSAEKAPLSAPEATPELAGYRRTTPEKGTPERAALDERSKANHQEGLRLYHQEADLMEQIKRTGASTKKRATLEKKLAEVREKRARWDKSESINAEKQIGRKAYQEDRLNSPNPIVRLKAMDELGIKPEGKESLYERGKRLVAEEAQRQGATKEQADGIGIDAWGYTIDEAISLEQLTARRLEGVRRSVRMGEIEPFIRSLTEWDWKQRQDAKHRLDSLTDSAEKFEAEKARMAAEHQALVELKKPVTPVEPTTPNLQEMTDAQLNQEEKTLRQKIQAIRDEFYTRPAATTPEEATAARQDRERRIHELRQQFAPIGQELRRRHPEPPVKPNVGTMPPEQKAQRYDLAALTDEQLQERLKKAEKAEDRFEAAHIKGEIGIRRMRREAQEMAAQPSGQPPSNLTNKIIKAQRENLLEQLDEAIKDAPEEAQGKITISVPGDGEFTLINRRETLKEFRKIAEKRFPKTMEKRSEASGARTEAQNVPSAKKVDAKDVPKVVSKFVSEDPERAPIQSAYADGRRIVATDGRQMFILVQEGLPGSPGEPVRVNAEGKAVPEAGKHGQFPNFEVVLPEDAELVAGAIRTDELWHIGKQASEFTKRIESKHRPITLELFVNRDGSLGGRLEFQGEKFEHNVQSDAIPLGTYDPEYILRGADAARKLGNETLSVYGKGALEPIIFVGKNHEHILAPVRGETLGGVVDMAKPASIPANLKAGALPRQPRLGPPVENPYAVRSERVQVGNQPYYIKLEGDEIGITAHVRGEKETRTVATFAAKDVTKEGLQEIAKREFNDTRLQASFARDIKESVDRLTSQRDQALKDRLAAQESAPKAEPPQEMREGPGASTPGDVGAKAEIEQLTDAAKGVRGERVTFREQLKEAFNIGEKWAQTKDVFGRALEGLKTSGKYLQDRWQNTKGWDDILRIKGELSSEIEQSGWRMRQFVKAVRKQMPSRREREAITNFIEADGNPAVLRQRAAATTREHRQSYYDALNLSPDAQTFARNIQNYFEAVLQEAIDAGVIERGVTDYIHRIYRKNTPAKARMLAQAQSGALDTRKPGLAMRRVFAIDLEAEQAGYRVIKDFLPRIVDYEVSLRKAIASRNAVRKFMELKMPDGKPMLAFKGIGVPVEDASGIREATLIRPHFASKEDAALYKDRTYPALRKWKWVAKDADGKPIFLQGDVSVHRDAVQRIDALLRPSAVTESRVGRGALMASSTVKQTMLDFSMFHQVQIAVHALEHKVGPFQILQDIDLTNPEVLGLLKGGVTLGGEYHADIFSEGLVGRSLSRHIPGIGPMMQSYHEWLFQDFIPRVKMSMALRALERNRQRFPKLSEEELYYRTAKEANAAFGELNYTMMERSKTARDISRIILLAPDFLEARGRFAGQALTKGGKGSVLTSNEQRQALLLGAITMYLTARIVNKALDDNYRFEPENAFSIVHKDKAYSLRTVQGDLMHLASKPAQFWFSRVNPLLVKPVIEALTGRDYRGVKRSFLEQAWDQAATMIPIAFRTSDERHLWESMMAAFGVNVRRFSVTDQAYKLAEAWKKEHGVAERGEFIYRQESDPYRPLKIALSESDDEKAVLAIKDLVDKKGFTRGKLIDYFRRYANQPFTGSAANDRTWIAGLSHEDKQTVEAAKEYRKTMNRLFLEALRKSE